MKKTASTSTKKIIIAVSILAVTGITGFLGYKLYTKWKKKKDEKDQQLQDQINALTPKDEPKGGSTSGTTSIPAELNTTEKIKAFQDWCDKNNLLLLPPSSTIPNWHKLNKGAGYGTFGKNTASAWKVHKNTYLASLGSTSTSTTSTTSTTDENKDLVSAIAYLKSMWRGTKSSLDDLLKTLNSKLIITWAEKHKGLKTAFIWENQIYDTTWCKKRTQSNPLDKMAIANPNESKGMLTFLRKAREKNSSKSFPIPSGVEIGIIKNFYYNQKDDALYLFIPNSNYGDYVWANNLTVKW